MSLQEMTQSQLAPSFLPATAVLEMTFACNHFCLFCSCPWEAEKSGYKKEKELSFEEWKGLILKFSQMGVSNFAFTGGEALLKEHILDLIEYTANLKVPFTETVNGKLETKVIPPKIFLLSNGKIISDQVLDVCEKHNIHLSMSLPGLETYEKHTGNAGTSPNEILYWFSEAQKRNIATTANITVTQLNIHELYETIANALIAGAGNVLLNRFLYGGRGIQNAVDLTLTSAQIIEMLDVAQEVLSSSERYGNVGTEIPFCLIPDMSKFTHLKIGTSCSAAKDFFTIGPDGYVRTCNHSPKKLVHVKEIEDLKDNAYWKQFVFNDFLPSMCSGCVQSKICDGGCREAANILHGRIDAKDPVFS